jgi:hypothetical protein
VEPGGKTLLSGADGASKLARSLIGDESSHLKSLLYSNCAATQHLLLSFQANHCVAKINQ